MIRLSGGELMSEAEAS